jgi:hypothetical protein
VVAQMARAHLLALGALLEVPERVSGDAFDAMLKEMLMPGPGALAEPTDGPSRFG